MKTWFCLLVLLLRECSCSDQIIKQTDLISQSSAEEHQSVGFGSSFSEMTSSETANDGNKKQHDRREKHGDKLYSVKTSEFSTDDESLHETDEKISINSAAAHRQRDLFLGLPNLSDPCFRAYDECIVINAQPYERRSNTQLTQCKQRCMESQVGIYSCRSIVYDSANQICDLFAHQGDQLPAKLLKYREHTYLEPTFANGCELKYNEKLLPNTAAPTEYQTSTQIPWHDSIEEVRKLENCREGKVVKYLRTQGFELDGDDRLDLKGYSLNACADACTSNSDNRGNEFECRSFDYSESSCSLYSEAAAPIGSGQLKQNEDVDYFEKFCIHDDLLSDECRIVNRFPQMILFGFAEVVLTTKSFAECFENCLRSRELYSMNCTSATYFYEEQEQNCILNRENRLTQKNLFVEENTDIVDYFEATCPLKNRKKLIKYEMPLKS